MGVVERGEKGSGRVQEPVTVFVKEYLPGALAVAVNELQVMKQLLGDFPDDKWKAAITRQNSVPVIPLLGARREPRIHGHLPAPDMRALLRRSLLHSGRVGRERGLRTGRSARSRKRRGYDGQLGKAVRDHREEEGEGGEATGVKKVEVLREERSQFNKAVSKKQARCVPPTSATSCG